MQTEMRMQRSTFEIPSKEQKANKMLGGQQNTTQGRREDDTSRPLPSGVAKEMGRCVLMHSNVCMSMYVYVYLHAYMPKEFHSLLMAQTAIFYQLVCTRAMAFSFVVGIFNRHGN